MNPNLFTVRLNQKFFDGSCLSSRHLAEVRRLFSKCPTEPPSPFGPEVCVLVGENGESAHLVCVCPDQWRLVVELPLTLPARARCAWSEAAHKWFASRTIVRQRDGRYVYPTLSHRGGKPKLTQRDELIHQWNDELKRQGVTKAQRVVKIKTLLENRLIGDFLCDPRDPGKHELKYLIAKEAERLRAVPQQESHFPNMLPRIRAWMRTAPAVRTRRLASLIKQWDERIAAFHPAAGHQVSKHNPYQPSVSTIWRMVSSRRRSS